MKKLFFLFIAFCSILTISCSDDDWNQKHAREISKVYREPDLKMTINGKEVKGKNIMLLTSDLNAADIMLIHTIPGEDSLMVSDVKLTDTGKDNIFSFKGESVNNDRKVTFEGEIGKTLTVNVTHQITSKVVGRYKPQAVPFMQSPLVFNVVPSNPLDSVNMDGFLNYPGKLSYADFNGAVGLITGIVFSLMLDIQFDISESGNMSVSYESLNPATIPLEKGQTDPNLIRYNIKNNNSIYLSIAVDDILSSTSISGLLTGSGISGTDLTTQDILILVNLIQQAYKGIPLIVTMPDDNTVYLSVTREMILPYLDTIMKVLQPLFADLDMGAMGAQFGVTNEGLINFSNEFARIVKESKSFEMQIRLGRMAQKSTPEPLTQTQLDQVISRYQNEMNKYKLR